MITDGPVFREFMDRFNTQKRFTTFPDYAEYLLGKQLTQMRKEEWDIQAARIEFNLRKKKK